MLATDQFEDAHDDVSMLSRADGRGYIDESTADSPPSSGSSMEEEESDDDERLPVEIPGEENMLPQHSIDYDEEEDWEVDDEDWELADGGEKGLLRRN
jgi:hypothetical protein